jgi:hypothetical protein
MRVRALRRYWAMRANAKESRRRVQLAGMYVRAPKRRLRLRLASSARHKPARSQWRDNRPPRRTQLHRVGGTQVGTPAQPVRLTSSLQGRPDASDRWCTDPVGAGNARAQSSAGDLEWKATLPARPGEMRHVSPRRQPAVLMRTEMRAARTLGDGRARWRSARAEERRRSADPGTQQGPGP